MSESLLSNWNVFLACSNFLGFVDLECVPLLGLNFIQWETHKPTVLETHDVTLFYYILNNDWNVFQFAWRLGMFDF